VCSKYCPVNHLSWNHGATVCAYVCFCNRLGLELSFVFEYFYFLLTFYWKSTEKMPILFTFTWVTLKVLLITGKYWTSLFLTTLHLYALYLDVLLGLRQYHPTSMTFAVILGCWLQWSISYLWQTLQSSGQIHRHCLKIYPKTCPDIMLGQKLRCHKMILWHVISQFTELILGDIFSGWDLLQ